MSTRSKAKRATTRRPANPAAGPATRSRLQLSQDELTKAAEKFRAAQDARARAVRAEWEQGMSAQAIADVLKVSRTKVYEILSRSGGARPVVRPRRAG